MSVSHSSCTTFLALLLIFTINLHSGASVTSRHAKEEDDPGTQSKNRKLVSSGACTNRDISISQSRDATSGIPQYMVQIINTCVSGCAPSNIHLHCGWFASAKIVNPNTFKRLSYDDCVVNQGRPLKRSQILLFTYSNSFMYPLHFKSAKFC
ncbi:hypothetical protein AMTRI_Chr02g263620 [Amborella trichopoda]|uniref:Protein TAPETUM DETERMINANT 1 n=1 Tax=Amborella trichopoda TaxID=13333 RepID=W1P5A9_AMBTC|nr:protein TAPETUM DETERMINANT 1 [Amborella trichopoda]ERN03113.1 hypothetical protein AMTR_s00003p00060540 [Amborella trichopoda]|eukprot:XP_006841438.1 protein TAPETUM DETERMINANT 1 [Amborella trichopoda]